MCIRNILSLARNMYRSKITGRNNNHHRKIDIIYYIQLFEALFRFFLGGVNLITLM